MMHLMNNSFKKSMGPNGDNWESVPGNISSNEIEANETQADKTTGQNYIRPTSQNYVHPAENPQEVNINESTKTSTISPDTRKDNYPKNDMGFLYDEQFLEKSNDIDK